MKNLIKVLLLIGLGVLICLPAFSQEKSEEGTVRIPWDEFRKLLELDKDEVVLSWQEFQKIINQTGQKFPPPFQLRDEKVVLTREQFKRLLDQMKPHLDTAIQPPADFLITKASYSGTISQTGASFQAQMTAEVFDKIRTQYVKIPLFPQNIALQNVQWDGRNALVFLENNRHTLATDQTGTHRIDVDFFLKTGQGEGPGTIMFPVPRTPIVSLEVELPEKDIDVEIAFAQQMEIVERAGKTRVSALLSPTDNIHIKWHKKIPEIEKGPPKIYADTINHIVIDDDALRVNTEISLSVLQNTISSLTLKVPESYSILDVRGSGLGDWKEVTRGPDTFLDIPFEYPKKGTFSLQVSAEKLLPNASMSANFTGFAVPEAIREKGFLGIELKSTSEVTLAGTEGLDKLDVSELPSTLINRSQKPLLFGFKYLRHPYSLVLDIQKHEALSIISTVVDSASGVTMFTEDGKIVHRIIYKVRNTSKQFMELSLPEGAQMWSVFVGGAPAKPRLNKNKILLPLNRSRQGATGLAAFDVEIIYYEKSTAFKNLGQRKSFFPVPDVIVSQMLWSVYLPVGYKFIHFGGSVEKEKGIQGLKPLLTRARKPVQYATASSSELGDKEKGISQDEKASELKKQFSPNLALQKEQLVEQMKNEGQFSRRVEEIQTGAAPATGGILPIRINVPTTGQVFRFAKTIVSDESLTLNFTFISSTMMSFIWLALILLLLFILFLLRKKIARGIQYLTETIGNRLIPIIFLLAAVILWFFSKTVAVFLFIIFLILILVPYIRERVYKTEEKKKSQKE
ncbi:MAG: hypothetical protein JXB26_13710 [Candidatus Aminicenantes bacterium]|nr:hypothetical protein [Candidatus Aminicenantes bacterium]